MWFSKKQSESQEGSFGYLSDTDLYFDSACQTLRPQDVMNAVMEYYSFYNACGGRVGYPWGKKVDAVVEDTRKKFLQYVGKSSKEYTVAFTLNTTYGINLVLQQLPKTYAGIITSDIEHNSVFLPTQVWAKERGASREVLERLQDGSLDIEGVHLDNKVVLVNSTSNIDGKSLVNARELGEKIHGAGGLLMLDAAQTLGHEPELLRDVDFDVLFGSVHKMYGPSLGVIIIKHDILDHLEQRFVGGGLVSDVQRDTALYVHDESLHHVLLESGLQNWAGIVGAKAALEWLDTQKKQKAQEKKLGQELYAGLKNISKLHLTSDVASSTASFYVEDLDSHKLALTLGQKNIMVRSGYFCCHYGLKEKQGLPPLLRVSLGLQNTPEQVYSFIEAISHLAHHM